MPARRTKAQPSAEPVPMASVAMDRRVWSWLLTAFHRWRACTLWENYPPQYRIYLPPLMGAVDDQLRQQQSAEVVMRGAVFAWHWVSEWLLGLAWNDRVARKDRALFAEIGRLITVAIAPHLTLNGIESDELV